MSTVTKNIKTEVESMIVGIRTDIGQIKSQFEKYNDNMEEFQTRLSSVEDKMVTVQDVGKDLTTFKKENKHTLSEIELEACRARKNNIIFHGLPGGNKDTEIDCMSSEPQNV